MTASQSDNRSRQTWGHGPDRRLADRHASSGVQSVFLWLPPLFARIVVGWVFMWSGWTKLNNLYPTPDFPGMISRFAEWGIPYPSIMAPFVSGVEFIGGLLLLLGLFTRLAATPLVIVMIVAVISAKWDQVDSLETLLGFEEVAYMALFGWLAVQGPGPISVDHLLQRRYGCDLVN